MEIRLYKRNEIAGVADQAEAFYLERGFKRDFGVKEGILGSRLLALALDESEVIGAGRVVGDGSRFSLIVDLVVRKDRRGRGIGTQIAQTLAKACNTLHVNLTTDPNDSRLPEFYRKAGFELVEGEHVFDWPRK